MIQRRTKQLLLMAALATGATTTHAGHLEIWGAPGFDAATGTGFQGWFEFPGFSSVSNSGMGVGSSNYYVNGVQSNACFRAVRWDASGNAVELGNLGATAGDAYSCALAINDAGTSVGYCSGTYSGEVPVRWDAGSTVATVLAYPQTTCTGGRAQAINTSGVIAGICSRPETGTATGVRRAVRWDASGVPTELGGLGFSRIGAQDFVWAINDAGAIAGVCDKYVSGQFKGSRAVRWDPLATAATELDVLGTGATGSCNSFAYGINSQGTIIGKSNKYMDGVGKGVRAVRWNGDGTAVTELGGLGTAADGTVASAAAYGINDAGTTVGTCTKYVNGVSMGSRAVRWEGNSTKAVELPVLGTDANGVSSSEALAVSRSNVVLGSAATFVDGQQVGGGAVVWLPNNDVVELQSLRVVAGDGVGTWILTSAMAMSEDGWACGRGTYDPDGAGPLAPYDRMWTAQVGLGGKWLNTGGDHNKWGKGANWSTGTPAIQLDATFDQSAAYNVGFDSDASARKVDVAAGSVTLLLAGYSLSAEQGVVVQDGARLAANGTIVGDVTNDGVFAPGNSPGPSIIDGNYVDHGTLEMEIASLSLTDTLTVSGDVDLSGTVSVVLYGGYVPTAPAVWDLIDWGGTMNFSAHWDLSQAVLPEGFAWDTSSFERTGELAIVALPEPRALGLLALGCLTFVRRPRRVAHQ